MNYRDTGRVASKGVVVEGSRTRRALRELFAPLGLIIALVIAPSVFVKADGFSDEYIQSLKPSLGWKLPKVGPTAKIGKKVNFIAANLRNSGILGVAEGVREASSAIGLGHQDR